MPRNTLPPGQRRVYNAILEFWCEHRYGPTVRDIGAALGINSPNGVCCHLKPLEKKGWITRNDLSRSIVPLVDGKGGRLDWEAFTKWLRGE